MIRFAIAVAWGMLSVFALQPAFAAGWHYYDPNCPIALGPETMKFVAMQPKRSIERFCDALPDAGPSVIVLDVQGEELRNMTWDVRLLRDLGQGNDEQSPQADTGFHIPPQKYKNGMLNFDYKFSDPGTYILLVKLKSDDGAKEYVGRHHFTVGLWDTAEIVAYAVFAIVLAAGGGFAFLARKKKRDARQPIGESVDSTWRRYLRRAPRSMKMGDIPSP